MRIKTGVALLAGLLTACSNPVEPTGELKSDVGTLKYEVQRACLDFCVRGIS
jgi:hypothetical protein